MITLILLLVLGFAIIRVAWLGLMLVGLFTAFAGCLMTLASLCLIYPFVWWWDKRQQKRQAQGSISVWANSMEEAYEMARNWDGEVVINVVDDELPMKNITPLRRLLR